MQYNQYQFKFYFNASHAIYLLGELGQSHPHTWEIIVQTVKITDNFVLFNEIEQAIEGFLSPYQDVFINDVEPFTTINPTLENICTYFKECIQKMLYEKGWLVLSIELSETPTRSYVISMSNELDMKDAFYNFQSEEVLKDILDKMAQDKLDELTKRNETSLREARTDNHEQSSLKLLNVPDQRHNIVSSVFSEPNAWEIAINITKTENCRVNFNEVENTIITFLSCYQVVSMNKVVPVSTTNSTLENICVYFKECIQEMLCEKGWLLLSIELSQTPGRSHVIDVSNETNRNISSYNSLSKETLQQILSQLTEDKAKVLINHEETSSQEAFENNHEQNAANSPEVSEYRPNIYQRLFERIKKFK